MRRPVRGGALDGPALYSLVSARRSAAALGLLAFVAALVLAAAPARAAVPPEIKAMWSSQVAAKSARLHAELKLDSTVDTDYRFNYITEAKYLSNLSEGKEGFAGAFSQPPGFVRIWAKTAVEPTVTQLLSNLQPETAYRYRLVVKNIAGTVTSPPQTFVTQALGGGTLLPDNRGWEMVSPLDKNGGQVDAPGANAGGGVLQSAADGDSVTYSSAASFGEDAAGAPVASQYISRRGAGGWATENITTPAVSGSYGDEASGVPYQLFSPDLALALLLNGRPCRGGGEGCPVANPPLPGSGAPAGFQNYYRRNNGSAGFEALLGWSEISQAALPPESFEVSLAGATPDLGQVVLSSCAALTPGASEVPLGEGCDPAQPNLYRWSGAGLALINTSPGAWLAAQSRAISTSGNRVYWTDGAGLFLREGTTTKQVDETVAGGGQFETASQDGSLAFFTKGGHLYRYTAATETVLDLTPGGEVEGVLGASDDGSRIYYLTAAGLFLREGGTTTEVAAAADSSNYPPSPGTAHLTTDGSHLAFLSDESLTGYDNLELGTGQPTTQVYLYDAVADELTCISCNPTNGRPLGPSTIPGATRNGEVPGSLHTYKPRILRVDGNRLYFDSLDSLVLQDTNNGPDVYQWDAQGTGGCQTAGGCLNLISSGKGQLGGFFVDASAEGEDVFFLTDDSLVPSDPGSIDIYDARVGGGFPLETPPLSCEGDACQSLPAEPGEPVVNTLIAGAGNPPVRFFDTNRLRPRYHRLRNHTHKRPRKGKRACRKAQRRCARGRRR